ncbi:MAG TPA: 4-(cytidine 5'-diphospho)-2-C-methyl-D-erythritol kinase [Chitinophagaceae bacterium]|nr:4-(cytidine 5'-diphospho)-2-C-methyl-D-erythritol kinase [Chitinophagaceae bacterium]
MIAFPNCKINLGLNILAKKEDGFHDLETVFFPINIYDVLELIPSQENTTQLTTSGISLGEAENNICLKAYYLLKKDYPDLPAIKIHLHKAIPLGAGLGGGSADGVATLQLLNKKFSLNITENQFFDYALKLGSDCPFFLLNKPVFASGRGEILEPLQLSLSGYKTIIINPGIHISTTEAFKNIIPSIPKKRIKEILKQSIDTWKKELVNDFEKSVFKKYPLINKIKNDLYEKGAIYSAMSGSGSTVYGIFKDDWITNYIAPYGYFYKIIKAA